MRWRVCSALDGYREDVDVQPLVDFLADQNRARDELDVALLPLVDEALRVGAVFVDCRGMLAAAR